MIFYGVFNLGDIRSASQSKENGVDYPKMWNLQGRVQELLISLLGDTDEMQWRYYTIMESYGNAVERGNLYDDKLMSSLKIFRGEDSNGEKYLLARIRDSGLGFDYLSVAEKNLKQNRGMGFVFYKAQGTYTFFEDKGSTVNILVYDKDLIKW
ncbi:MAG: hypothetical protein HGA85_05615 [Nanoarchaeota archaeon]|nr:hypothetical protein [Nanoarchaeota archaeon]